MRRQGKLIGLTGGIASGKSTAAAFFKKNGAVIIDADRIAHQSYEPGTNAWHKIVETFGAGFLAADQTVDRKKLGKLVFANPDKLRALTDIVWPETGTLIRNLIASNKQRDPLRPVILEAAVLTEAGWESMMDEVWLVTSSDSTVKSRLMKRNSLSEEEARDRIRSQMPPAQRELFAHRCIKNDSNLASLERQLQDLLPELWKNPK